MTWWWARPPSPRKAALRSFSPWRCPMKAQICEHASPICQLCDFKRLPPWPKKGMWGSQHLGHPLKSLVWMVLGGNAMKPSIGRFCVPSHAFQQTRPLQAPSTGWTTSCRTIQATQSSASLGYIFELHTFPVNQRHPCCNWVAFTEHGQPKQGFTLFARVAGQVKQLRSSFKVKHAR